MLKLVLDQPYTVKDAPVKIGSYQTGEHQEFTVKFDLNIPAGFSRDKLTTMTKDEENAFWSAVVAGWSGIADQDGNAIPFNEQNKKAVFALDAFKVGLFQTLMAIALGQALEKN